jgi:putative ABC transport system ATP-binding protein
MLRTQGLTYAYGPERLFRFPDLHVRAGEPLLLLGPSGCGKTTLLHLLAGLLRPRSGEVWLEGTCFSALRGGARDRFRGQQIGIVFQRPHFVEALSVRDNLLLGPWLSGARPPQPLDEALASLGLEGMASRPPRRLSLGEQQRLGILRAVLQRPRLLLADEPTAHLDDANAAEVAGLLARSAAEAGAALLIVTHDARLAARFPNQLRLA